MISPLPTLSQYAHKCFFLSYVNTQICVTSLASAFTKNVNIFPSNSPCCTHAPLNEFFCLVIYNVSDTSDNISCLIALRERGKRKPQVFLSLKKRDVINRKWSSSWLLALSFWCSIFPNTQKIIKFNNFQVYHHLLLCQASFPMSAFAYSVWQARIHC